MSAADVASNAEKNLIDKIDRRLSAIEDQLVGVQELLGSGMEPSELTAKLFDIRLKLKSMLDPWRVEVHK